MSLKEVEKVWGKEIWLVNNELYCCKELVIKPGGCSSSHFHVMKDETFLVMSGSCHLQIMGLGKDQSMLHRLQVGNSYRIEQGVKHRFWVYPDEESCTVLEVSTHHDDRDVRRLEESKILAKGEYPYAAAQSSVPTILGKS